MSTDGFGQRRADAQRNREAILAAGLAVLSQHRDAGLAEIARASGLTRTTVYAHFATRDDLLEELLRRAVDDTTRLIDDSDPTSGPPPEALLRVVAASWRQVGAHAALAEVVGAALGERAAELHAPVRERLLALLRRGRRDGSFRRDLPERWLLTTYFALVHAAGPEVAAGACTAAQAERNLGRTLLSAYAPPGAHHAHRHAAPAITRAAIGANRKRLPR